ncbi:MAG: porin family protein [Gammaproteobacteria bacterium]|nr:porin family protein [Gammaproteobacteria bacterium]
MKPINKAVLLAVSALGLCSSVYAADNGLYAGAQLGYANIDNSVSSLDVSSTPLNINGHYVGQVSGFKNPSVDNGDIGGRAYLGYQFNRYFSLEAGYTQYADTDVNNIAGFHNQDISLYEGAIDTVGKFSLPIGKRVNLYAKGGAAYVMTQGVDSSINQVIRPLNVSSSFETSTTNIDEFRPTYGFGASFDITNHLSTDVSWSQIVGGNNIPTTNFTALGLSYHL